MAKAEKEAVENTVAGAEVYLLPEEIEQDQAINLRPFSDGLEGIEELAASILEHGQIENVLVRINGEGRPHLIAGHRRVTAISLHNSGLEDGQEPLKVRCTVLSDVDDQRAWGMAWAENKDRENMSDMDVALNIQALREARGWQGKGGTKEVASYLGVSPAYVTTHEKLLTLKQPVQKKVHEGKLSVDAALALVVGEETAAKMGKTIEQVQQEVVEEAEKLAEEEKQKRAAAGKPQPRKGKGKVKAQHVTKAKRKLEVPEKKARGKSDIVEWLETEIDAPVYGHANGAVRKWAVYFLGWIKGEGTDRGLNERFKVMVEDADRGTEEEEKTIVTAAPGKTKTTKKKAAKAKSKK